MNLYAINIIPNYNNDYILSYRVERDYEIYYKNIQEERKLKKKVS